MAKKKRHTRIKKFDTSKWTGRPKNPKIRHSPVILLIPSGKCPAKLAGTDHQSVLEWAIKLTKMKPEEHTYKPDVYRYWVRDFYNTNSEENALVKKELEKIITKDVKTIKDIEGAARYAKCITKLKKKR